MLKCYYRTPVGDTASRLRMLACDIEHTAEGCKEAVQAVLEQLHKDMEVFLKPILVLIPGGKTT